MNLEPPPGPPPSSRAGRALERARELLRKARPEEAQWLFGLTVLLGAACGLAAVAFHLLIILVSRFAIDRALAAPGSSWLVWTLAVPTAGGLVSGALLQYLVPKARGSGIPEVKVAYARKGGRLALRDSVGKFFISALQIGTGTSLGREGPTVQICAGIAFRVGRMVRLSAENLRRLFPLGAAAGIAAAFNAPIAAVTFTIEEIVGKLDQTLLSGVIVAAAVASVVERSVLGGHPLFDVPHGPGLQHASSLLLYAALGLAASGLSILFTDGLLKTRRRFQQMRWVPAWMRPALGALGTGVLAVAALAWLGTGGVTGGGYQTLGSALSGQLAVHVLVPLCFLKLASTVLSYASGGAGGIFAPALFIGGMAGGAFGALDMAIFGHSPASMGAFALVGMGAVFAGIIRAPITSVLIIIEMTDGYALIVPLMIANMLSYGIARHLRPTPIYEALLEQDGIRLHEETVADHLGGITVADVPLDTRTYLTFQPETRLGELLEGLSNPNRQEVFPVVREGTLVGVITLGDLVTLANEPDLKGLVNAADVMRPPVSIRPDEPLRVAFESMLAHGVRELPVVDGARRVVGFVDETSIAHAYASRRRLA